MTTATHTRSLGMSMFATKADYFSAVESAEGYQPSDAFNDGEYVRENGGGTNPYDKDSQPKCFAAWNRGLAGTSK